MKKIFIDANILIDFFNKNARRNQECSYLISIIFSHYKPSTSPTTFAITYFFGKKAISNISLLNKQMKDVFSMFEFSSEDEKVMKKVFDSEFKDLEDALQYHSAQTINADCLVTYNLHDYFASKIPVMLPMEFIQYHFSR